MAKFYGKIGYMTTVETEPGIWTEEITEREYTGDIVSSRFRYDNMDNINDDVILSKTISIVVDPYAIENYGYIRYVDYLGTKWKITSVDPQLPRLNLTTGGLYYGDETGFTE